MKIAQRTLLVALCLLTLAVAARVAVSSDTEKPTNEQAIRAVLEKFVEAMRARDVEGVKRLLHSAAIAVETTGENCRVEILDAINSDKLVPPEGNKDWEKITFEEIQVQVSPTNPVVASVSFVFRMKLDDQQWEMYQKNRAMFEERAKQQNVDISFDQLFRDHSSNQNMFALMAKKKGEWKIVGMTFPH